MSSRRAAEPHVYFEDDEVLFDFLRMKNVPSYVSVPAFVEHGGLPSLAGNPVRKAAVHAETVDLAPESEGRLATAITMCPWFWRGTPYTLIRSGSLTEHAWRYVHWSASAPRLGLSPERLRALFDGEFRTLLRPYAAGVREFCFSLWIMSLLLGLLPRTKHITVSQGPGGPALAPSEPDEELVRRALDTLVPGGLMKSALPVDAFADQEDTVRRITQHGYRHGRTMPVSIA
jgi:hypothetical protein